MRKKKLILVGLGILLIWAIICGVDYCRFLAGKKPLFCIRVSDSGEEATYVGLGYKIADRGRNVTEMVSIFGKERNLALAEDDIRAIEEFLAEGDTKADNAESFASVKIYGHSFISEEKAEVYLWVLEETFFPQQGGNVTESGASMPCLVTVDLSNGGFKVIGKQFPRDGSLYAQDMKELFPYGVRIRFKNVHRSDVITELSQENRRKAMQHFYSH